MQQTTAASAGPINAPATSPEDSARQLRLRVLNDISDRKVARHPLGAFLVNEDTQVADHERADYIQELRRLIAAAWVMEYRGMYRHDRDGVGVPLRLTTLGEVSRDRLEESLAVAR